MPFVKCFDNFFFKNYIVAGVFGRLIASGVGGCHFCHNVTVSQGVGVE